eukprot:TRINITY_DN104134_c0_g1_i1.p1 TRINITY_DN104134_c0_g1~~TRINITY_DN104134_c0_g1_i1.p1  ORF type:complete len:118 (+),score=1.72 TRINITY_DN104134_c0_g1_i1:553-906(+)
MNVFLLSSWAFESGVSELCMVVGALIVFESVGFLKKRLHNAWYIYSFHVAFIIKSLYGVMHFFFHLTDRLLCKGVAFYYYYLLFFILSYLLCACSFFSWFSETQMKDLSEGFHDEVT